MSQSQLGKEAAPGVLGPQVQPQGQSLPGCLVSAENAVGALAFPPVALSCQGVASKPTSGLKYFDSILKK